VELDDKVLGPDPLLVHYRQQNEKLTDENQELTEKIRDLEETLAERERYEEPSEQIKCMRNKIAKLKERSSAERKQYDALSLSLSLSLSLLAERDRSRRGERE